jgi:hypothetical protein
MGSLATLKNFVQAAGVPVAAVQVPVAQAPLPLDIIQELYGCFVNLDNTAPIGTGVQRETHIALVPTIDAVAQLVTESGGKIQSVLVTNPGLDYVLPPICRALQTVPPIGGPPTGVGGLLRAFLNVNSVTFSSGGTAFDPATTTAAFVGGLPPADSNRAFVGCVKNLGIVDPGFGYDPATQLVVINGGNPSRQARAKAVWDKSGRLKQIILLDMGADYTAVPKVAFALPPGARPPINPASVGVTMAEGEPATAMLTIAAGVITAVTIVTPGSGYVFLPNFVIDPGGPLGSGFVLDHVRMQVERIDVIAGGTGYHDGPAPTVSITPVFQEYFPSSGVLPDPNQARPWGRLQSNAISQQALSPVVPRDPVIT